MTHDEALHCVLIGVYYRFSGGLTPDMLPYTEQFDNIVEKVQDWCQTSGWLNIPTEADIHRRLVNWRKRGVVQQVRRESHIRVPGNEDNEPLGGESGNGKDLLEM